MKEKIFYHLPIISLILTTIFALITGAFVGLANTYPSEENTPTWLSVLFVISIILMLSVMMVSTIVKNKNNTKTIELYIEIPIAIIGYVLLMIFINKEVSTTRTIWLTVATSIFFGGLMPGVCSVIGKIRKPKY